MKSKFNFFIESVKKYIHGPRHKFPDIELSRRQRPEYINVETGEQINGIVYSNLIRNGWKQSFDPGSHHIILTKSGFKPLKLNIVA